MYMNEPVFVFAVQLCFWKILNFLAQTLDPGAGMTNKGARIGMVVMPKRLGLDPSNLGITTMPDLTNNKQRK